MTYNYGAFPLAPYGDYWRQVRKIIMHEVLSHTRVEMLGNVRVSELRASAKDIYKTWRMNKDSEGSDMVKMDIQQLFGNLGRQLDGIRTELDDFSQCNGGVLDTSSLIMLRGSIMIY
ncbi:strychnine-10-hydroxylase-like [Bidens hawaiensis]|uniref:strychnine-10-hydroxylase-like n=1 Tax=Bidens hawaiensis TaxID=980011 RepID=UPI00404A6281